MNFSISHARSICYRGSLVAPSALKERMLVQYSKSSIYLKCYATHTPAVVPIANQQVRQMRHICQQRKRLRGTVCSVGLAPSFTWIWKLSIAGLIVIENTSTPVGVSGAKRWQADLMHSSWHVHVLHNLHQRQLFRLPYGRLYRTQWCLSIGNLSQPRRARSKNAMVIENTKHVRMFDDEPLREKQLP